MRVTLITEGTYPYHTSGTSTWCHQLVTGLPQHAYHLVALTTTGPGAPAYPLPGNVTGVTPAPVWGAPATGHRPARGIVTGALAGRLTRLRTRRAATGAAVLLCRGLLGQQPPADLPGDPPADGTQFRDGLIRLAQLTAGGGRPLAGTPLADVLADAWRVSRRRGPTALPPLSLRDAETGAALLEHALRPLSVPPPGGDLCHATSGGLPLLVALAAQWRTGTPYLLSEQGIYLRERYLDYGRTVPAAVRELMLRFFRALSRLGYAQAALVVAGSRFQQRWQLRHGAHPARVVVVPAGADPAAYPRARIEPTPESVVWVGRVEPLKDLHTLLRAFRRVHRALPHATLRLVGPATDEEYASGCRALVRRLGLADVVRFTGSVARAGEAYAAGQVVVSSSVSEGTPYALIEAMLTGRATVSTDVGGVAELVGDTGRLVPPGDPAALADALLELLRDPARCRALGAAAAHRARTELRLDHSLRAYDQLYADVADTRSGPRVGAGTG